VEKGNFREDLYYRLKVMTVRVPPLREHPDDIPFLAETFLQRYTDTANVGPRRFTREALRCLEIYPWPGNVRELSHVIERAVTLSDGEWIETADFGLEEARSPFTTGISTENLDASPLGARSLNLDDVTQHLLLTALKKTRRHKGQAASLLGVHPRTLTRMMRRYGIPDEPEEPL
jgi:DNA-binding NtrC family response regulator